MMYAAILNSFLPHHQFILFSVSQHVSTIPVALLMFSCEFLIMIMTLSWKDRRWTQFCCCWGKHIVLHVREQRLWGYAQ